MAFTLADIAKLATDNFNKKFIVDLARHKNSLVSMLPIESIPGLEVTGSRLATIPTTGKRKLNSTWTASTGRTEEVKETVSIYGGKISVDRIAAKVQARTGMPGALELQTQALRESMIYTINTDAVNGDHGVDPDGMEGFSKRVGNGLARYDFNLESGGVSHDSLSTQAKALSLLGYMHAAANALGGVDLIVCNEKTKNLIGDVLRYLGQGNLLSSTTDNFERKFDTLFGAPLVDVGYKSDFTTEIISNTQGTDSGGSAMYFIRKGGDEGLSLIQLEGTGPEPFDPMNGAHNGTAVERDVEWALGMQNTSRHSAIARIKGFKAGAY